MPTTVHLVRHGRVAPDPARPAAEWTLHPEAEPELSALRRSGLLPSYARWFSSPEPKAFSTARALTDTAIGFVDGLREMTRPVQPWLASDAWSSLVRRSVDEPDTPVAPGWETAAATSARVVGAVRRILDSCPDEDVVLVGHGTAWTLVVAALTALPPDLDAWEQLRMPDHCALEISDQSARVVSEWGRQPS